MRKLLSSAALAACLVLPASLPGAEKQDAPPIEMLDLLSVEAAKADEDTAAKMAEALTSLMKIDPDEEPADLVLRNRTVATLRASFAGESPRERAAFATKNFFKAVSGRDVPELRVRKFKPGNLLVIGQTAVIGITYLDLDPLGNQNIESATAEAVRNLELILAEIREERSLKAMVRAAGLSVGATIVLALLLWLTFRLRRSILHRLEKGEKIMEKGVGGETVREARTLATATRLLVSLGTWALAFFLSFMWTGFVLRQFPYTRPWGEEIRAFVFTTLQTLLLGILSALPNIFTVILIIFIARFLTRLVKAFFDGVEAERIRPPMVFPETAMPTRRLLTAIIWVFAFVAMYPYLPGSGSEAFRGLGVILGLMLSLGASGVVGQAMSGLILMYSRALRRGDYVRIAETEGVVLSLGMLATKIRTIQREEVTIPNTVVLSTSTKNFSRLAGREGVILHTNVTIGYSEPWRKVHEALIGAAGKTAGLKSEPKPFVSQTALSDFYVEYKLNAYLESPEKRLPTLAALHANIQDTFNAAGVVIVSPHYVNDPPHPAPEAGGQE